MNNLLDQRKIGFIIGGLFIFGAGIYFYQQNADRKDQEGKSALYKVQKTFEDETNAIPADQREPGTPLDVDAKFSKTVSELNGIISSKSTSNRVLFEANVKLGTLYLDHGQADKAVNVLKGGTSFAKTSFQRASQFYLLGTAEERNNLNKEALASYREGVNEKVDGLQGDLLLSMVRMSLKLGDKEHAKLYLEKLNKEAPGSKSAETADALVKGGA